MKIVSVKWLPGFNLMTVQCNCGHRFKRRTDRSQVRCKKCGKHENIQTLREDLVNRIRGKSYEGKRIS